MVTTTRVHTDDVSAVPTIVAQYKKLYEALYGSPPVLDEGILEGKFHNLVSDHGSAAVGKALTLLFDPNSELKWVKTDKLGWLSRQDQWNKHVVPLLAAARKGPVGGGEQAEFGARPEGAGYRRVW